MRLRSFFTVISQKVFGLEHCSEQTFAVDLSIFVGHGGGLQSLATFGTAEAGFMPGLDEGGVIWVRDRCQ